jgi:hypothetical protein
VINQIRGTVTYEDGSVVDWRAHPRDVKAMETYARRQGIVVAEGALSPTLAMYLAYSSLRVEEGFDVWLDRLDDFEDLTGDELVDPFPTGASLER